MMHVRLSVLPMLGMPSPSYRVVTCEARCVYSSHCFRRPLVLTLTFVEPNSETLMVSDGIPVTSTSTCVS